ncbi:MAG TPA: secondary thiamine-phosphate synthase enzyme YjbQ [bacterium]|nr:secondary thiamine-phosphate synthase enzyme YjbQ [bacterium]
MDISSPTRTLAPLKIVTSTLTVRTGGHLEVHDLTDQVASLPGLDEVAQGVVLLHTLHTTTALCINEAQDALLEDMQALLRRLVPERGDYRHNDPAVSDCNRANAWSHLAAVLLSHTLQIPVEQGRPVLGTWQRILFFEMDGPQTRRIHVQVMGA